MQDVCIADMADLRHWMGHVWPLRLTFVRLAELYIIRGYGDLARSEECDVVADNLQASAYRAAGTAFGCAAPEASIKN